MLLWAQNLDGKFLFCGNMIFQSAEWDIVQFFFLKTNNLQDKHSKLILLPTVLHVFMLFSKRNSFEITYE